MVRFILEISEIILFNIDNKYVNVFLKSFPIQNTVYSKLQLDYNKCETNLKST